MGAGIDADLAESLLRRSGEEDVKKRLKEETEAALRRCGRSDPLAPFEAE